MMWGIWLMSPDPLPLANGAFARAAEAPSIFRKISYVAMSAAMVLLADKADASAGATDARSRASAEVTDARSWKTYTNARYRYAICYPADLLKPGRESDDGDGVLFRAASGASLRVWGGYNAADESLAALAGDLADPTATITYRHLTRTSATVSGRKGGDIFYAKTLLEQGGAAGTVRSFILTYPAGQASTYNPVSAKLSSCLRVLQDGAAP